MDFFEKFAREHGLRLLQPLGGKPETIWLAQTAEGEKRVLRRYAGRDTVCRKLVGVQTPQLAQVYACQDADEDTVSEEEYIDGTLLSNLLRRTLLDERQAAAAVFLSVFLFDYFFRGIEKMQVITLRFVAMRVHRDVKPENVMLTKQGRVVLLDLDAAAPLLGSPDRNTRLLGTAGYAAPEQFGFARCDVRADIFALGVLLNVMLTGEHPSVCLAKGRLGRIIRRCTHTNAAQRYESVDALLRQLPKAGPAHLCALCGGVTPGGGCVWCGGAAKRKAGQKLGWVLAAAIAGLALAVGGYAIGLQNPTAAMARPAQAQQQGQQEAEPALAAEVTFRQSTPVEVAAWPGGDIPFTAPFFCDLDGDGEEEQYCFAVADIWPGVSKIRVVQRGGRGYAPGIQITENYLPVICRETADGGFEAVPELVDLLEDPVITLYYLGERPKELISAVQLPGKRFGVWTGEVEARATLACAGEWVILARATVAGQPVEAAIRKDIHPLEE